MTNTRRAIRTQVDESTLSELRASLAGVEKPAGEGTAEVAERLQSEEQSTDTRRHSPRDNFALRGRPGPEKAKRTSVSVSLATHQLAKRLTRARMLALAAEQTVGSTYLEGLRLLEEKLLEEGVVIPENASRLRSGPR